MNMKAIQCNCSSRQNSSVFYAFVKYSFALISNHLRFCSFVRKGWSDPEIAVINSVVYSRFHNMECNLSRKELIVAIRRIKRFQTTGIQRGTHRLQRMRQKLRKMTTERERFVSLERRFRDRPTNFILDEEDHDVYVELSGVVDDNMRERKKMYTRIKSIQDVFEEGRKELEKIKGLGAWRKKDLEKFVPLTGNYARKLGAAMLTVGFMELEQEQLCREMVNCVADFEGLVRNLEKARNHA
ncbi:hypothetical protein Ocin01_08175 [Orchesella cincta]|uniref:Uncharacterized protein n=1 Tax=Orchesella cincta TaxID=48709 RepID=A0A1D2MZT2_ORCCI|nr:hypothetical protein Ocin01_08175 [Orchesella cincta]